MSQNTTIDQHESDTPVVFLYPLVVETFLLGLFSFLIMLSTYLLICRSRSCATLLMLSVTLTMYITAVIHWSANLSATILCFADPSGFLSDSHGTPEQIIAVVSLTINVILSDIIVLWRAWLLWDRKWWVMTISACLLLATTIAAVVDCVHLAGHVLATFLAIATTWPTVTAAVSLVANVWATALVAHKTWCHRRFIREHMQVCSRRTSVEMTLSLLVESGTIYCLYLIVVLLSTRGLIGPVGPIFGVSVTQVAGIYPTIIAVLVCLRKEDSNPVFSLQRQTTTLYTRDLPMRFRTVESMGSPDASANRGVIEGVEKEVGVTTLSV
ncbi:hypothetical protein BV25DRAFT_1618956 [Artomyces pyxidatus]|uniref:Uncharacterized protein n=1 Tax=Artomyces pyxidatus TaxID=48021 RepID=A0ACB8TD31_9AGAM|nr:hypothetical protein BV25DRAFT_1618956 [Artomyces pyxidatus]